jgi:hypothetical protein
MEAREFTDDELREQYTVLGYLPEQSLLRLASRNPVKKPRARR